MKKIITTAMLAAAPVAAYAANDTMTAAQSMSRQTSSEVNVSGTWETERLTVGQSFTVGEAAGRTGWNAGQAR